MGIVLVNYFSFDAPDSINAIITLGILLIVFLVGDETGLSFVKANFRKAMTIGLPRIHYSFHSPFGHLV